ncbi:sensor histidine kinase [Nocardia tengchongensis]|uniref:histidine kinase n=1 Tax=Nocardia tengchongensis TaxID=2055889 RepID=A0ABX8CH78_9NOCA|nr:nitrate- and nitrite sensing domain-containing protein [Nocardia tengchongensis]QVI19303.1 sensor histidine kinase [Nocardia tengchongensis]
MFRARLGVRTRVLAIALVPSLALLAIGVGGAGYLVVESKHAREWADALSAAGTPTGEVIAAVEQERQLSLAQMSGADDANPKALAQARTRLDNALLGMAPVSASMKQNGPESVTGDVGGFLTLTRQLAGLRTGIDTNSVSVSDTYYFYGKVLEFIWIGTRIVADHAPNATVAMETLNGLQIVQSAEMLSREAAVAEVLLAGGALPPELAIEFSRVAGTYRVNLGVLAGGDGGSGNTDMQALMNDPDWTKIVMMENVLISRALDPMTLPPAKPGTPPVVAPLTFTPQEWRDTVSRLTTQVLKLWEKNSKHNERAAAEVADTDARNSALVGGAMVSVSALAFLVSLILANRIIRRLKGLRNETLELADERLPEIMAKLRDGRPLDADEEKAILDFGHDEIGQVAKAFTHAHASAVTAAITEARTREGVKAMFLNIAHRSQVIVHRQLEILDAAESKQEDPALLDIYFRLDHLATRERRNAENLIILAGGQPGRQWRNPVQLLEIVRSSVGETADYTRVKIARLPDISIVGSAVADLVHLLAELVDNAAHFSPPQSQVEVRGNVVGKGVAIEIIDQGMGMPEEELTRINAVLREAPDFGVAMLPDDFRLGRFVVAQLAARHGISVRLTESDYGGVRAIVLVPTSLTVQASGRTGEMPVCAASARDRRAVRGLGRGGRAAATACRTGGSALDDLELRTAPAVLRHPARDRAAGHPGRAAARTLRSVDRFVRRAHQRVRPDHRFVHAAHHHVRPDHHRFAGAAGHVLRGGDAVRPADQSAAGAAERSVAGPAEYPDPAGRKRVPGSRTRAVPLHWLRRPARAPATAPAGKSRTGIGAGTADPRVGGPGHPHGRAGPRPFLRHRKRNQAGPPGRPRFVRA